MKKVFDTKVKVWAPLKVAALLCLIFRSKWCPFRQRPSVTRVGLPATAKAVCGTQNSVEYLGIATRARKTLKDEKLWLDFQQLVGAAWKGGPDV